MKSFAYCGLSVLGCFAIMFLSIGIGGDKAVSEYWSEHATTMLVLPLIYGSLLGVILKVLVEADNDTSYMSSGNTTPSKTPFQHYSQFVGALVGLALVFGHFLFTVVPLNAASQTLIRNIHFVEPYKTPLINVEDVPEDYEFKAEDFTQITVEALRLPENVKMEDGRIRCTILVAPDESGEATIIIPKPDDTDSEIEGEGEVWFQLKDGPNGEKGRQSYVAPF